MVVVHTHSQVVPAGANRLTLCPKCFQGQFLASEWFMSKSRIITCTSGVDNMVSQVFHLGHQVNCTVGRFHQKLSLYSSVCLLSLVCRSELMCRFVSTQTSFAEKWESESGHGPSHHKLCPETPSRRLVANVLVTLSQNGVDLDTVRLVWVTGHLYSEYRCHFDSSLTRQFEFCPARHPCY